MNSTDAGGDAEAFEYFITYRSTDPLTTLTDLYLQTYSYDRSPWEIMDEREQWQTVKYWSHRFPQLVNFYSTCFDEEKFLRSYVRWNKVEERWRITERIDADEDANIQAHPGW